MPQSSKFRNHEDIVNEHWSLYTRKHQVGVWHGIGYLVDWFLWALLSNPSSDRGTINYWLVETLKHNLFNETMSNFTLTTSTDLGWSSKMSRMTGAMWISNAGPVVILLLLNDFKRVWGGERRTANDCLPPFSLIRDFRKENTRGNVSWSLCHSCTFRSYANFLWKWRK